MRLHGGRTRERSNIRFRGFHSQGDGASFESRYSHARGAAKAIRAHAPKDTELHGIADPLQHARRRNFWQIHAAFRRVGAISTQTAWKSASSATARQPVAAGAGDTVALRNLARWFYRQLRDAREAGTSDPAVDGALAVNEWTFTRDGKRFG